MYVYLMMVLIHICTQLQKHSQPLIFLFVLRTFEWRLILWFNRIYMIVIIFLLNLILVFRITKYEVRRMMSNTDVATIK